MPLTNKIILVTGASSGIGAATALALNAAGAKVAIAARREDKLKELALQMHNPLVIAADLNDELSAREMVQRVAAHFGGIHVLINNAASIIVAKSDAVRSSDLLRAFSTNLIAPVVATQEAIRLMRKQGGGHIINIGSPGFMMGIPFYAPYVCSKAAFSAWTRTIQAEWAGTEIIVSEYFPGYIKTDSLPDSRVGTIEQDFLMADRQNAIAAWFTKPKTPEDVARHIVKLIIKPQTLVYSDIGVKIGAFISNIPGFRLNIARQLAKNAREKKNLSVFSENGNSEKAKQFK
ncbi:MAG: SDR family NAD(P)-dependent oxidoreductase [Bacteroidetes bacterium]|nr:SDR family NAD(P)-dependent oxidoreductase [Bacteroidota bacterium]